MLVIRHTGDGPAEHARAKASATGTRPSKFTTRRQTTRKPCQPEHAPLHADDDDIDDTVRRSDTSASSPDYTPKANG